LRERSSRRAERAPRHAAPRDCAAAVETHSDDRAPSTQARAMREWWDRPGAGMVPVGRGIEPSLPAP
jgi:hypothetical protein